jgi:hypothetical protein
MIPPATSANAATPTIRKAHGAFRHRNGRHRIGRHRKAAARGLLAIDATRRDIASVDADGATTPPGTGAGARPVIFLDGHDSARQRRGPCPEAAVERALDGKANRRDADRARRAP